MVTDNNLKLLLNASSRAGPAMNACFFSFSDSQAVNPVTLL